MIVWRSRRKKIPTAKQTVLTTTGAGTWTVPPDVTSLTVTCIGPGGSGAENAGGGYGAGGGGGGALARKVLTVTGGTTYNTYVGAGGSQSDTYFDSAANVMAKAGTNAPPNPSGLSYFAGGTGGTAAGSVGTTKFSGGNGGAYYGNTTGNGGSGGGAAGLTGNGGNGLTGSATFGVGVAGGVAGTGYAFSGAGGAAAPAFSVPSSPGGNYGGGGAGSGNFALAGAGAQGVIVLDYISAY